MGPNEIILWCMRWKVSEIEINDYLKIRKILVSSFPTHHSLHNIVNGLNSKQLLVIQIQSNSIRFHILKIEYIN